jgi:5-methylcytosine-specific restriction endonuclease McrA
MVHTPRTSPPAAELVKHGKRWTARFQAIASGSPKGDWATPSAKKLLSTVLRGFAHGKCVYCESVLEVTGYLEVEHYVSKKHAPHLAFEWTNLLPACQRCNNAKSDQDHKQERLIKT